MFLKIYISKNVSKMPVEQSAKLIHDTVYSSFLYIILLFWKEIFTKFQR